MKKIAVGQAIQIFANIAMIWSVVFLALEIQQSNRMMLSQTRSDISRATSQMLGTLANQDTLNIFNRGRSDPQHLTVAEQHRFDLLAGSMIRVWENAYFQYRNGLFTQSEFEVEREAWKNPLVFPVPWSAALFL